VIFKYVSSGFNLGRIISMISLILALGFCVASVRYRI
jgi:hypothetical protein